MDRYSPLTLKETEASPKVAIQVRDAAERRAVAAKLVNECSSLEQTPAALYLESRSIDPYNLPEGVAFFHKQLCAIVFLVVDSEGQISAAQRVMINSDGSAKERLSDIDGSRSKIKITNGVLTGAGMILRGQGETLITDGPEDALTLWQATGRPVICTFGQGNIASAPLKKNEAVTIIADRDGKEVSPTILKQCKMLHDAGHAVRIALPDDPALKDSNALMMALGADAVRALVSGAKSFSQTSDAPLPLFDPALPPEPYPVDALGPLLSLAAYAIAKKVQVPDAIAAQSVLSVASLACQALADVALPYGQRRPLSLFFQTVGGSGERKTSADKEAGWPIHMHEKKLRAVFEKELEEWKIKHCAWSGQRKAIETEKGLTLGDRELKLIELGKEPERPLYPILTAPEPTIEGLIKLWPDAPASLGIFSAEGGGFIGGHGMSQDNRLKTAAGLSEFWDGNGARRLRAGDGLTILQGRRLAMHLMVQPDAAALFFNDPVLRSQGLLSRILIAFPDSLAGTRLYRESDLSDDLTIKAYGARILSILERPWPMVDGKRNELELPALGMTGGTQAVWKKFFNAVESRQGKDGQFAHICDFASKAAEHAARIAGVLTLVEDPDALEIDATAAENACVLIDWYLKENLRIRSRGYVSPAKTNAAKLLDWIKQRGNVPLQIRTIMQMGPSPLRQKEQASEAVNILIDHGWIEELSSKPRTIRLKTGLAV